MINPYFFGWLVIFVLYMLSIVITRSGWPWALARGHENGLSASLLQFLLFTGVTAFAYVTTFAARAIALPPSSPIPAMPEIPVNLLILMGLSVATASGSKGITVSYLQKGEIPREDKGNVFENREGGTDLTKVQMIIWTFIAVVVYIVGFRRFVAAKCYLPADSRQEMGLPNEPYQCPEDFALPDIDGALLVLMGVSQGGYVAGKLVSRTVGPKIEYIVPTKAKANEFVSIYGNFFGDVKEGNSILFEDSAGAKGEIPGGDVEEWSDSKIRFKISDKMGPVTGQTAKVWTIKVISNSQTGIGEKIEVIS